MLYSKIGMLKNKWVFWSCFGALVVVLGAGGWFVLHHDDSKHANIAAVGASESYGDADTQSNTIDGTGNVDTGVTISDNSSQPQSTTSNSGSSASSLLDPTTFSKYDSYKDAQTASYVDMQTGTGAVVGQTSQVAVVYKGWLTNGSLFDESKAGSDGKIQAFGFIEGQHQVISGWESGLIGAKEGGVRLLIIPPAVGYGATGQGPIPGNSVLVFQVQIVQVK
jgi:FKBP-type peptidyl-prolyl cis-trans isomerase FkpA